PRSPSFTLFPYTTLFRSNLSKEYTVYVLIAPKLSLSTEDLNPQGIFSTEGFDTTLKVLKGTDVGAIEIVALPVELPANTTLVNLKAAGALFTVGSDITVDFTEPVEFEVTVYNTTLDVEYTVTYTVTVTELN